MSATEFLATLDRRGVRVTADGETLKIDAPAGAVAPWELDLIRKYKSVILDQLIAEGAWDKGQEPIECPRCGALDCWWNGLGQRRCMVCDPPSKVAQRYLETLTVMRRQGDCPATHPGAPARGLIGCGFPPVSVTTPPPAIVAEPVVICRSCKVRRVVPGLPWSLKELCFECYSRE